MEDGDVFIQKSTNQFSFGGSWEESLNHAENMPHFAKETYRQTLNKILLLFIFVSYANPAENARQI